MWAGQFYSRGAYTIFPHTDAENDTFPFLRRAGMGYFRPGVRKTSLQTVFLDFAYYLDVAILNLEK